MPLQKIEIRNNSGEILRGLFHKPSESKQLSIVCHGFTSDMTHPVVKAVCSGLEKEEMNSFRFDFSGKGESEGNFGRATYSKERDDLECIIDYFEKLGYEIVCVIGFSMGGAVAIMQTAQDARIKSIIDIAGITTPERIKERFTNELIEKCIENGKCEYEKNGQKFSLSREFFQDALGIDMFHTMKKVNVPVLFISGEKDERADGIRKLYEKSYKPKGIKIIDEADHDFTKKARLQEMVQACIRWMKSEKQN